jgi:hypothetical protein
MDKPHLSGVPGALCSSGLNSNSSGAFASGFIRRQEFKLKGVTRAQTAGLSSAPTLAVGTSASIESNGRKEVRHG